MTVKRKSRSERGKKIWADKKQMKKKNPICDHDKSGPKWVIK